MKRIMLVLGLTALLGALTVPAATARPSPATAAVRVAHADPKDVFVTRYVQDHDIVYGGGIEVPYLGSIKVKYRQYYRVYLATGKMQATALVVHQAKHHGALDGGWPLLAEHVKWHVKITDDKVPGGYHVADDWGFRHKTHYDTWVHNLDGVTLMRDTIDNPRICVRVKIAVAGPDDSWKHLGCEYWNQPDD